MGWVKVFQFLVGWVGLRPLQQKYEQFERIMLMRAFTADLTGTDQKK